MASAATWNQLKDELSLLGVEAGDVLFIHSSFKSLGPLANGVDTVIKALQVSVGPEGMLLMPSFNLHEKEIAKRISSWDVSITPSSTGYITEAFRKQPSVFRSDHYSHSVAAWGKGAEAFIFSHRGSGGMRSPWDMPEFGCAYGDGSPFQKAYHSPQSKVLMIGVDYESSTFCHLVEVMDWNRRLGTDPDAQYNWLDRAALGAYWDSLARLRRGRVGDANCRLFPVRDFVDTLAEAVGHNPGQFARKAHASC